MTNATEYMSLKKASELLGATYQLIYRLARADELPAVRLGKLYRVSRTDLDDYFTHNKNATASGGTCSVCGTFYKTRGSRKHAYRGDDCNEPIYFDCWA